MIILLITYDEIQVCDLIDKSSLEMDRSFPRFRGKGVGDSYRATTRFGVRLTGDEKKEERNTVEENAFVTRERRILGEER